jgi:histidinol-phosphate aminotransferase
MSPNDPSGAILTAQDAVRIARACAVLVVDERHTAYSPRTLLPLVREFENIVVLRTFETWAGLNGFPIAYAIAPPKQTAALRERRFHTTIAASSLVAAHATLDDLPRVNANVERIRAEKARLYRTLRKLNMIRPMPSWANFLLARVERGDADHFAAELYRRHIYLHRPAHPQLTGHFRISAVSAEATAALKNALIEIATSL